MNQINKQRSIKIGLILILFVWLTGLLSCNKSKKIQYMVDAKDTVMSVRRSVDDTICASWDMNKSDILKFLHEFDTISGYEWNHCYGSFDCKFEGVAQLHGKQISFSLNAGGWARLWDEHGNVFIGTHNPFDSASFISVNYCGEDWD